MKIIKEKENKYFSLDTKEINFKDLSSLKGELVEKIINLLSNKPSYPKEIAKNLNIHEQNIYYYIRKLEQTGLIKVDREESINGSFAKYYSLSSDSIFVKFKKFKKSSKILEKESNFLNPFIENGKLNSLIIVGSPDPHGPQKARSKDGYFGMDFALFLGSFLNYIPNSYVRLDTEVSKEELHNSNLIIIGGPIVNKISQEIQNSLQIYYDESKKGIYSKCSKKTYFADEIGYMCKIKSIYNKEKEILYLAGLRNSGTKAMILAFLKYYEKVKMPNLFDKKYKAKIVEGIDLNSDGVVDDLEFLE
jgi:predicted transcriptional regulator